MSDSASVISGMSAETGYEEEVTQPLRVSGFLSVLFALVGIMAFAVPLMVLLPLIGLAFALFGLRRFSGPVPVGYGAAALGLVLCLFIGSCAFFLHFIRDMSLASQAEYFARQYVGLVARGESELALELKKAPINRFLSDMPLEQYYENAEAQAREMAEKNPENAELKDRANIREAFMNEAANKHFYDAGLDAEWELERATRIYHQYGRNLADVILVRKFDGKNFPVLITLAYQIDKETGDYQWHVDNCVPYTERLVAESIL